MELAGWFVGPIMAKIINACYDYLDEQVGWQTGMKKDLERLRRKHPKIQAVVFAANQAQINDESGALNKWIWQLRDAIDEADDVLDEFEYMKLKQQVTQHAEETKKGKVTSFLFGIARKILKNGERDLKIDPNLKRLEEAVQKLDKVSADVTTFLPLLDSAKKEHKERQRELCKARETGYLPKNDLFGRDKEKELVVYWLRKPSKEHGGTDLYRNISLLSIVGHGGMGKTTLLQHVYKDEDITKEFNLKMWVCVSNNFDVKKVIADMLECITNSRSRLETLVALQRSLEDVVKYRKFLLVLDDVWEDEEERDKSKWENVLAPLASGRYGSKILITTRTDSVARMFAKVIPFAGLLANDPLGRGKEKELVMESHDYQTTLYVNISLICIMGQGGVGRTTLVQHIYEDEKTKEFDFKMWVCVSKIFDVKKVIADMLECLDKKKPDLDSLDALQGRLQIAVRDKKFLLILDDIWVEEENRDISKWENLLAPLAYGKFGSRILATTQEESFAMMIATVIKKKTEIFRLDGLEEDHCLQLLNSHAFAGVENPLDDYKKLRVIAGDIVKLEGLEDDVCWQLLNSHAFAGVQNPPYGHKKLRAIAGEIVKKLLGYPLAAKVIGGVLNDNLDERHWMTVLKSNVLDQNSINSILRMSYIVLPNPLKICFAICCVFPQDHKFGKDDLVRMWIALGFIQPSQGMTMEDIGGRYFDVLVKKTLLEKVRYGYKMHDLIHVSASNFFAQECGKLVDDEQSSLKISETVRYLYVQTINLDILRKIRKFKHLQSLFLFYEDSNQDLYSALIEIFKVSKSLRVLYIFAPSLKMIPEEIEKLIHLRYLKIDGCNLTRLPRSSNNLYHLQYRI